MSALRILAIGDIAGKPGMRAVKRLLPKLVAEREIDFVVANGENTAGGVGITGELAEELFEVGVGCVTTGNHIWRQQEVRDYIRRQPKLLRPANFPSEQPGRGFGVFETPGGISVGVINLAGRVFMDPADNPFAAAAAALEQMGKTRVLIVDIHAEASSEKRAMGFFLAGKVTAVFGTHTHVQTADEQILPEGTAYITDVGMTGPHDSVIGMRKELIIEKFVTGMPHSFKLATQGVRLQALYVEADRHSGCAMAVERLDIPVDVS